MSKLPGVPELGPECRLWRWLRTSLPLRFLVRLSGLGEDLPRGLERAGQVSGCLQTHNGSHTL